MEITTPGFLVGEMAWLSDGRSGRIVGGNFNADAGEWLWALDGVGGPFRESDLFRFDPTEITEDRSERFEPPGEFVTQDELAQAVLNLRELIDSVGGGLSRDEVIGIAAEAAESAVQAANARTDNVVANAATAAATALSSAIQSFNSQLEELESTVANGLSLIGDRLKGLETEAEESSGLSIGLFFRGLGAFLRAPWAFVLEQGQESIIAEVQDGLNR